MLANSEVDIAKAPRPSAASASALLRLSMFWSWVILLWLSVGHSFAR